MHRRPWREELEIIDRTMRAISSISDPEELVTVYWDNIGALLPVNDYMSVSRRHEVKPNYVVTRSSRFTEDINPWTHRHLLPHMSGGLVGEIIYSNKPAIIDDLPSVLSKEDPAFEYLDGFASLVGLPQYDGGESLNLTVMLLRKDGNNIDPAMIPMLHWQAGLFGRGTTNLVLRNELSAALARLDKELQVVGEIQKSLLPASLPDIPGFDVAAWYRTSARAGGDYYDFFPLSDGGWGLFIADVSGHGTPAAVLMAITHAIAHAQPGSHTPPPALLQHLNDHLTRSYTNGGTFVTAFYAVLDPKTRKLQWSSAGHNPPRLVRKGRVMSLTEAAVMPLGIVDEQPFQQCSMTLEPGDLLLLYTDGVTEATPTPVVREGRELFGTDRLDKLLIDCVSDTAEQCVDRVRAAVDEFATGAAPVDDQTLIAIRCV